MNRIKRTQLHIIVVVMRRLLAIPLLAKAWLAATAAAQTPQRPLVIGYLRADGVALPFAVYSGKYWRFLEGPRDLARQGVKVWNYRLFDGRTGQARVLGPSESGYMYDYFGHVTDYPRRPVEPNVFPVARIGIVTNHPVSLVMLERVPTPDSTLIAFARSHYEALEDSAVAAQPKAPDGTTTEGIPAADSLRRAVVPTAAQSRAHAGGLSISIVAFSKQYGPAHDRPGCAGESTYETWLVTQNGRRSVLHRSLRLPGCDGKGWNGHSVHALLQHGDRIFIIAEYAAWESMCSKVYEVTGRRLTDFRGYC
jgi:hypothetical protein